MKLGTNLQDLLDLHRVRIVPYKDYERVSGELLKPVFKEVAAFYDTELDIIAINPESPDPTPLELIVTHELIHWTGHPSRLDRESLAHDWVTEEMVANLGMVILGGYLQFDTKVLIDVFRQKTATFEATQKAIDLAREAAIYLRSPKETLCA